MGYSNSVYKAASDILHERRLNAEKAAERRKEEVYERFPRVKELEKQISMSGIKTARAVLAGGDVKVEVEKLRIRTLQCRRKSRGFLQITDILLIILNQNIFVKSVKTRVTMILTAKP